MIVEHPVKEEDREDMRSAWTHEELQSMRRANKAQLEEYELYNPNIRRLPPLSEEECREQICSMLDTSGERPLTVDERFLFGQFVAQYRQSIEARMLGKPPGRYYVVSEADMERQAKGR